MVALADLKYNYNREGSWIGVLISELYRSNTDVNLSYEVTLENKSQTVAQHDRELIGHTQRVTRMTLQLAKLAGVPEEEMSNIFRGALLHDIGKVGIPESILFKSGQLTPEEWDIMHSHTVIAFELLSSIPTLHAAVDIPYCHHERWDGTGYPQGLIGEEIPLSARIFSVVDVWDALNSDRLYRKAWPHEQIINYIRKESGRQFDPKVVDIFLKMIETASS